MLGTIVLVVLVIFLFLRRFVATAIPTLSLPVSLVGAVSLLWAFGYTIDNISLARPDARRRPGRRRRDRHAREHHAPRRARRGAVPGGAARLARGRLHDHLDLELAGRGVHPDLLHAGRDRPPVPRVRGHRRARHRRLGVRLAHARADAGEPLPERRGAQEAARGDRPLVRARLRRAARQLHALARRRTAPSRRRPVHRLAHVRRNGVAVRHHPEGLLPAGRHRPDQHLDRGRRRRVVPGDGAAAGARRRCPAQRSGGGDRQLVQRRRRLGRLAQRRSHVHQPEAARRTPADEGSGREPAQEDARGAGYQRLHAADPEPAARRPTEQGAVPVHPAERAGRRTQRLGVEAAGADAQRPDVPRRHQRLAAERACRRR